MGIDELVKLADAASEQHGLITTAQAEQVGLSRLAVSRLKARGALQRLEQGVYAVGEPMDSAQRIRAKWLALDPKRFARARLADAASDLIVSHASAASLHGIGDLRDDVCEFTSAHRRQTTRQGVRLHTAPMRRGDWLVKNGLPVTSVERTIVDVATSRTNGADLSHVGQLAAESLDKHLTTEAQLTMSFERIAKQKGATSGAELLLEVLSSVNRDPSSDAIRYLATPQGRLLLQAMGEFVASNGSTPHSTSVEQIVRSEEFLQAMKHVARIENQQPSPWAERANDADIA